MPSRHRSRERALQVLFQWDLRKLVADQALDHFYGSLIREDDEIDVSLRRDRFMEQLFRDTVSRLEEIDGQIQKHSEHWRLDRMDRVDKSILRMGVFELLFCDDIPSKVAMNEAVDLGKKFGAEESGAFINGILDTISRTQGKNEA